MATRSSGDAALPPPGPVATAAMPSAPAGRVAPAGTGTAASPAPAAADVRAAQASRAGRKPVNEDAIGIRLPEGALQSRRDVVLALADGVSGSGDARHAAEACVQGFLTDYYATPATWSVRTSADRVLAALNRWLHGQALQYTRSRQGLLATFSALVLRGQAAHVFHIGDSRVWRLRGDTLELLTRDHATSVGGRDFLTRALGMDHVVEIDFAVTDACAGDVFLLTSDGVHGVLPPARLRQLLAAAARDPQACCERLLDAALAAGSDDNVSCQLLVVDSAAAPDAGDSRRELAQLPLLPDLVPGQRLDGLRVERELQANARSQVYLVRDEASGEALVLKTPSRRFEGDAATLERFALEDWLGQALRHDQLVRGLPPPRPRSGLYLLQEYLEGETLAEWSARHPLPAPQAVVELAAQAIRGLQALHRREVLHQDLRPANVLLCRDGRLKLIDLGSAGLRGNLAGDCPGAAEYAAPEVLLGQARDERADQYSLAVTLHELLSGSHPYGEDYARIRSLFDLRRLRYRSACAFNPHVPPWLDAALAKALAPNPEDRYETLSEFLADLRRPNPALANVSARPWLERDPAGFWRAWALLATALALLQLFWQVAPFRH